MGKTFSTNKWNEKCIQNFSQKFSREEASQKTELREEDNINMDIT
jgi:hypothetical protein